MIEMLNIGIEKTVAYRVSGKVTEEDMVTVFTAIKDKIETEGDIYLYQEIESLNGVGFDAIIEKLKFLADIGISHFKKIAIVTDRKWMQKVIRVEDSIFSSIEMRAFSFEEREKAFDFLKDR